MILSRSWTAALAIILLAQPTIFAQSSGPATVSSGSRPVADENVVPTSFQALAMGNSMAGGLPMIAGRQGQFFAGGEYLHIRALPSEAIAYAQFDASVVPGVDTLVQFDFDHEGSYRFYGGYRLGNCGEEIRFTYTSLNSGASADTGVVDAGSNITFIGPLDIPALNPGERIRANADVSLKSYDIGWSKTIPLGCPMDCCDPCCGDACCGEACGDSCGTACCDPCGCWCPAWDITYTAALRFADYSASRGTASFGTGDVLIESGLTTVDFDGVGGRFGLLGRRYLGKKGVASLYMKGDISLLLGDVDVVNRNFGNNGALNGTQQISCTHVIPVTEIEAGGTVFLTCNTSVSGGYMLGAWHDLGFREDYNFGLPTQYDDANIMAFDGFFLRLESSF